MKDFESPNSSKRKANYLDVADAKSSKRLETSAVTPINEHEEACSKAHLIYHQMCDYTALGYYNNENNAKFELVVDETLDSYPFTDISGSWIHCSFNAKEGSSVKGFFSEIKFVYPPTVTVCKILEGDTKVGCESCKSVTHPVVGYRGSVLYISSHVSHAISDDGEEDRKHDNEIVVKGKDSTNESQPCSPNSPDGDSDQLTGSDLESYLEHVRECAELALASYNGDNATKFKLVGDRETIDYRCIMAAPNYIWAHCIFKAEEDSCIKTFFAELKFDYPIPKTATTCKMLTEGMWL